MIKLIATDLDGTLLDSDRRLPEEIFPLVTRLHEQGVLFAPASGRQYASLEEFFLPVKDKVLFICENGALVKYGGKKIYSRPIRPELLLPALQTIRAIPHLYPMLCCEDCAYIESDKKPFYDNAMLSYPNCEKVPSLDLLATRGDVCKIAIYDELGAANNCMKHLPDRIPKLRTMISGKDWCDVSDAGANKGEAIRFLQQKFSLKKEECAAFGDHMNDYEMLLACEEAYVPENGYPLLIEKIGNTIPSNAEGGVIAKIKELIKEI
ncbi:MAG: HAD family hydrolase [Clostridiales bacterium]|nr:HAD family hydrolase [Clostridiales bacterium]